MIARAISGHTRTSESTDYCPNCTRKCVIIITVCKHTKRDVQIISYDTD